MKKAQIFGVPTKLALSLVTCLAASGCAGYSAPQDAVTLAPEAPAAPDPVVLGSRSKAVLSSDGILYRDLDGNQALTPYEDWRLSSQQRAQDLTARMTLAEKLGMLLHASLRGAGGTFDQAADEYDFTQVTERVQRDHVNSFITRLSAAPEKLAQQNNKVQEIAEQTRLGIPVTISSDPRNHFQYVPGASNVGGGFSQWPEPLGFAALGDIDVVRNFADIARREYRAVGIQMTLSPQADLASEPRWPRQSGTFGTDPATVSAMVGAYVAGFQGSDQGLTPQGVFVVAKHWVGYGAQPEGFDGHNYYGRFADLPGDTIDAHFSAFDGAFAAQVGGIMPAYPVLRGVTLDGKPLEQVAPGFNAQLLQDELRSKRDYQGVILSDWLVTLDCDEFCRAPTKEHPQGIGDIATSWGVSDLSEEERYAKGLRAGIDQFGGVEDPAPLMKAVQDGLITEQRIDQSVERLLISKFDLGLFDNPYVDPAQAARILGNPEVQARATQVQGQAQVMLQNRGDMVPMQAVKGQKVWLFGMDAAAAEQAGLIVVDDPAAADFALIRSGAPSEMLHPYYFFGSRQHEGRLDYQPGDAAYEALLQAKAAGLPSIFAVFLDRPAILGNIVDKADVVLGNFGTSDTALLDVLTGKTRAMGRLPFELPSSMEAVEQQNPAISNDSTNPLFPVGSGGAY
ncbi:glycoside hydrolase family 3 protein [Altererythrobacter endophyticus]|uniref:beta-glucosidase n=2 Tax=Altericroceibacterium endophyticum TaxID=1808508 RepID=A0A6I4T8J6_9SPHN|nr:glycoside hydrolase family 3 protein [Altericroceibacterium endophyticum]